MTLLFNRPAVDAAIRRFAGARHGLLISICAVALMGCTGLPADPYPGANPADTAADVKPVTDTGVLGNYVSLRPVAPKSWREQNERVAPRRQP